METEESLPFVVRDTYNLFVASVAQILWRAHAIPGVLDENKYRTLVDHASRIANVPARLRDRLCADAVAYARTIFGELAFTCDHNQAVLSAYSDSSVFVVEMRRASRIQIDAFWSTIEIDVRWSRSMTEHGPLAVMIEQRAVLRQFIESRKPLWAILQRDVLPYENEARGHFYRSLDRWRVAPHVFLLAFGVLPTGSFDAPADPTATWAVSRRVTGESVSLNRIVWSSSVRDAQHPSNIQLTTLLTSKEWNLSVTTTVEEVSPYAGIPARALHRAIQQAHLLDRTLIDFAAEWGTPLLAAQSDEDATLDAEIEGSRSRLEFLYANGMLDIVSFDSFDRYKTLAAEHPEAPSRAVKVEMKKWLWQAESDAFIDPNASTKFDVDRLAFWHEQDAFLLRPTPPEIVPPTRSAKRR